MTDHCTRCSCVSHPAFLSHGLCELCRRQIGQLPEARLCMGCELRDDLLRKASATIVNLEVQGQKFGLAVLVLTAVAFIFGWIVGWMM